MFLARQQATIAARVDACLGSSTMSPDCWTSNPQLPERGRRSSAVMPMMVLNR